MAARKVDRPKKHAKRMRFIPMTREQRLAVCAQALLVSVQEAISAGAVRLPYPGLLEAMVDLKRALKT